MLFDSSLRKELGRSFSATLVILATIVMTMMLIRTLGMASGGKVAPADVMLVMGFTVLGHLPTILTLSLFIAVVSTLSRMHQQSEMVIWLSSGQSLWRFVPSLLRFAMPLVIGIGLLALLAWPWANQQVQELRTQFQQRGDIDRVAAGQFQESADGQRVFFIEKNLDGQPAGSNIFIATRDENKESVTSAARGHLEVRDGDRFLMLADGQRTDLDHDTSAVRISTFESYGVLIEPKVADANTQPRPRTLSTLALLEFRTPPMMGELSWRLGLVLAAINLVLLGVSAADGNNRSGRTAGLIFSLLTFVVYYNLLAFTQSWIASGQINLVPAMVLLHGGILALAMMWLNMRNHRWHLRDMLSLRRTGARA